MTLVTAHQSQPRPVSGYLHPGYAQALSEFGIPTELPQSKGWLLKRAIPGCTDFDGMGCYPLFSCEDWSALASDLDALRHDLVSFCAVPDPFGQYRLADLRQAFPDTMVHFKEHYVTDLSQPLHDIVSKHHRQYAEKALRKLDVEFYPEPLQFLDQWMRLFDSTVHKFQIKGIRAYSRVSFAQQFALAGTFMSIARYQGEVIAAHIQMISGEVAYAHLAAANEIAHKVGAAYALYYSEIQYFAGKVRWLDWGGEAGLAQNGKLSSFKRGWATDTRPIYFCGRIFNQERYSKITSAKGIRTQNYFPAYREGEFNY